MPALAVEELEAWRTEGEPLLTAGSTGQLVEHPLVRCCATTICALADWRREQSRASWVGLRRRCRWDSAAAEAGEVKNAGAQVFGAANVFTGNG